MIHELERDVHAGPKWYERLRSPGAHPGEPLATSAGALAEDYQRLAEQVLARITAVESADNSVEVPA